MGYGSMGLGGAGWDAVGWGVLGLVRIRVSQYLTSYSSAYVCQAREKKLQLKFQRTRQALAVSREEAFALQESRGSVRFKLILYMAPTVANLLS